MDDENIYVGGGINPNETTDDDALLIVGMEFKSWQEAEFVYVEYAKANVFGIRRASTYYSRIDKGSVIGILFVCDKKGQKSIQCGEEDNDVKRKRENRVGCKARMRVVLISSNNKWKVSILDNDHNHNLTSPSKVGYHMCHKKYHKQEVIKKFVSSLHQEGISNSTIVKVVNAGSLSQDVLLTNQQCHDMLRKERENYVGNKCMLIVKQFQDNMKEDPLFWFSISTDPGDHSLRGIFWTDGQSRRAYTEFSEVLVFDITYKTNKFKMSFAPFTGINHHKQFILFGGALLINEETNTFVWLFEEWLKCMFNVAPNVIITYQDLAICSVIKQIFLASRHRYCSWHVQKHATEHLGLVSLCNASLANKYNEWYNCETIEESKRLWEDLIEKYGTIKLKWLINMYEFRNYWVPVYWRHIFTAGMTSSQRSESMNVFFDGFVHSRTPPQRVYIAVQ